MDASSYYNGQDVVVMRRNGRRYRGMVVGRVDRFVRLVRYSSGRVVRVHIGSLILAG